MTAQDFTAFYRPLFDQVLSLHRQGFSQSEIAEILNRDGHKTQWGNPIHQVAVHRILKEAKEEDDSNLVPVDQLPHHIREELERVEAWQVEMFQQLHEKREHIKRLYEVWQVEQGTAGPRSVF